MTLRIEVDVDRCEAHADCEQVAPELYQLDDAGELHLQLEDEVPPELAGPAEAGARACPVAALRVVGSEQAVERSE
ncbi:ferredoxin [Salinactinospora qingdaonensis]|uniref:ferredoxin n=1 Tax=Salinactinospora qingdaonensis TaxID=702744 RepID=UPI0031E7D00F